MSVKLSPCKQCGSTEIELWDCGYSSFNPGGGKCKCGNKAKGEAGCWPSQKHLASIWNAGQELTKEEKLEAEILALKQEMEELKCKIPKISVIVSLYNAGKFIRGFMENVMEQERLDEMEILLLDAQSTDETAATIAEFNHPSLKYHFLESKLSIYEAWNVGISLSRAPILTNWNADDRRRKDSMWAQYRLFEDPTVDISYGATAWSYRANEKFEENSLTEIYPCYNVSIHSMMSNNSPHCMPMWRKNLHEKFGFFDPKYPTAADFDFWLRCLAGGAKFKRVDEIVGLYYHNPEGLSTHSQTSNMREGAEIKNNYSYLI